MTNLTITREDLESVRDALEKRFNETNDRHSSSYVEGMNDAFGEALAKIDAILKEKE